MAHWVHQFVNNWATSKTWFIPDFSLSLSFPQRVLRVICGCITPNWCGQRRLPFNRWPQPSHLLIHAISPQPQHHQQHHPQHSPPQHPQLLRCAPSTSRSRRASFRIFLSTLCSFWPQRSQRTISTTNRSITIGIFAWVSGGSTWSISLNPRRYSASTSRCVRLGSALECGWETSPLHGTRPSNSSTWQTTQCLCSLTSTPPLLCRSWNISRKWKTQTISPSSSHDCGHCTTHHTWKYLLWRPFWNGSTSCWILLFHLFMLECSLALLKGNTVKSKAVCWK